MQISEFLEILLIGGLIWALLKWITSIPKPLERWLAEDFLNAKYSDGWVERYYTFAEGDRVDFEDWNPHKDDAQFERIQAKAQEIGFTIDHNADRLHSLQALRVWVKADKPQKSE